MEIYTLFILNLIAIILVFGIVFVFIEKLMSIIDNKRNRCKRFLEKHDGFFKILFILIFFFEQIFFISLITYLYDISKGLSAIIGVFGLIVVTTASFATFVWEHKFQYSKLQQEGLKKANLRIEKDQEMIRILIKELSELKEKIKESKKK